MAKPKSKLIANRSAHAVALSNDGVATRRQSATKVKKDEVDAPLEPVPVPALSRPVRPTRRPVDRVEPVAHVVAVTPPEPEPAPVAPRRAPAARKPAARVSAPKGPSLSPEMQERMRAMAARIESLKADLAAVENKKRGVDAKRKMS